LDKVIPCKEFCIPDFLFFQGAEIFKFKVSLFKPTKQHH